MSDMSEPTAAETAEMVIADLQKQLKAWRTWAQFVYLQGGPVTKSDPDLRAAVCAAHDAQVAAVQEDFQLADHKQTEMFEQLEAVRAALRGEDVSTSPHPLVRAVAELVATHTAAQAHLDETR